MHPIVRNTKVEHVTPILPREDLPTAVELLDEEHPPVACLDQPSVIGIGIIAGLEGVHVLPLRGLIDAGSARTPKLAGHMLKIGKRPRVQSDLSPDFIANQFSNLGNVLAGQTIRCLRAAKEKRHPSSEQEPG